MSVSLHGEHTIEVSLAARPDTGQDSKENIHSSAPFLHFVRVASDLELLLRARQPHDSDVCVELLALRLDHARHSQGAAASRPGNQPYPWAAVPEPLQGQTDGADVPVATRKPRAGADGTGPAINFASPMHSFDVFSLGASLGVPHIRSNFNSR